MAQIKVLDLNDSNSLSELSYEDAQKINGGLAFGTLGFIGGYGAARATGASFYQSNLAGLYGGLVGAAGGYFTPVGASLSN